MTKPNELFNQKSGVHLCFANLLGAGEEKRWGPEPWALCSCPHICSFPALLAHGGLCFSAHWWDGRLAAPSTHTSVKLPPVRVMTRGPTSCLLLQACRGHMASGPAQPRGRAQVITEVLHRARQGHWLAGEDSWEYHHLSQLKRGLRKQS